MSITQRVLLSSSIRLLTAALLLLLGLVTAAPAAAQSSRAGTGEVIAVRELTLKRGINPADFERFVMERFNPAWEGAVPGVKAYIAKADRGARRGRYALVYIFDSEKTRNAIAPVEDRGAAEAFRPVLDRLFSGPNQELVTMYLEAEPAYTDYVVLR
jgi:hypothetical protein